MCLTIVSVLLFFLLVYSYIFYKKKCINKIRFGHTQISVPKIGIYWCWKQSVSTPGGLTFVKNIGLVKLWLEAVTRCILENRYLNLKAMKNTVKPLYSGHHQDCKKVSAIERCPLHRGSSQICLFCYKSIYIQPFHASLFKMLRFQIAAVTLILRYLES